MSGKPRLLFLCQTLPFPPDGGVWIRTYHVLRLLARAFDITALCFERAGQPPAPPGKIASSREALRQFAAVDVFPLPQARNRGRFVWDHARSLLSRRVYTHFLYDSAAFRQRVRERIASTAFDLVHLDSLDLARYLPDCPAVPIVVVHHDIESALLRRRSGLDGRRWLAAYLRYQSHLMRRTERHWCPRVDLNVVMSDLDACLLERVAPGSRVAVVPNGVDLDAFQPGDLGSRGIAYVGGTHPFPNADALQFYSTAVLPRLREQVGDVPTQWIGRATPAEQEQYRRRHGIELTGYVADALPLMQAARCHIVPLRIGGGTRLKILNAWALGKPVVTTSIGCEGLAATDGVNLLIRDDPAEFAAAVGDVLRDDLLARRLGRGGRATAERLYGWDAIGDRMRAAYQTLAHTHRSEQGRAAASIRRHSPTARG